jgi:hypothetical protein
MSTPVRPRPALQWTASAPGSCREDSGSTKGEVRARLLASWPRGMASAEAQAMQNQEGSGAAHLLRDLQEPQQQLRRRAAAVGEVQLVVAQPAVQEALALVHLGPGGWRGAAVDNPRHNEAGESWSTKRRFRKPPEGESSPSACPTVQPLRPPHLLVEPHHRGDAAAPKVVPIVLWHHRPEAHVVRRPHRGAAEGGELAGDNPVEVAVLHLGG